MKNPVSITGLASVSALGTHLNQNQYLKPQTAIQTHTIGNQTLPMATIPTLIQQQVQTIRTETERYKTLDNSVIYALYTARKAIQQAQWSHQNFGVNIGSSRGATQLFEQHHQYFITHQRAMPLASPTTTLGNIASWVAQDLQSTGPDISHSITCSTALHAVLNGVAWLQSGMATHFLVGGSEAPLTPFTIAQMQALKIYAQPSEPYPCRSLDLSKTKNTMVLGEGAASICMEFGKSPNALAYITGVGYATEAITHNISLSADAYCFQKSMAMAIAQTPITEIDAIVMHAPGTLKGDQAEYKAVQTLFGKEMPLLTSNKWKIGHTFGASGMLSIEMAIYMLQTQNFVPVPFITPNMSRPLRNILVNAVGFGGNAVSVLLSKAF